MSTCVDVDSIWSCVGKDFTVWSRSSFDIASIDWAFLNSSFVCIFYGVKNMYLYIYIYIYWLGNTGICLLTISVNSEYNRRKKWIMSQNIKGFLFTQLVVRVDPQTCKLNMVHSSIWPLCIGYSECRVVTTQWDGTIVIVIVTWSRDDLDTIVVPCEGS